MALSLQDFKTALLDATDGITDTSGIGELGNAIATYVGDNAEVNFSWSGLNPQGVPDTAVTAKGKISGLSISLSLSNSDNQGNALTQMSSEIVTGFLSATCDITDVGFSTNPALMSSAPTVSSLSLSLSGDNREDVFESLANQIISYVTGLAPLTPMLGSHIAFTAPPGTGASVTSIA